jgi:hypothetical protein
VLGGCTAALERRTVRHRALELEGCVARAHGRSGHWSRRDARVPSANRSSRGSRTMVARWCCGGPQNWVLRRRPPDGSAAKINDERHVQTATRPKPRGSHSLGTERRRARSTQRALPGGGAGLGATRARERVVSARKLPRRGPPISDTRLRFLRRVSTWKLPFPARRRGSRGSVSCRGSRVSGALPCQGRRAGWGRELRGIRNRRSRRTRGDPAAAAPGVRCARRCRGERVGRERRQGGQRSLWRCRGETRRRSDRGRRRVVGQGFEGRASCAAAEARSTRRPWTWSPA